MSKSYRLLRIAHWIFIVFAYLFGIIVQGILAGLVPLIVGGEPISLLPGVVDGPTVPARAAGAISLLISAPLTFIMLHSFGSAIRLLLDLREQVEKASRPTSLT